MMIGIGLGVLWILGWSAVLYRGLRGQWPWATWAVGTRSVLYGGHCFFIHPWFVAWGWWKLYGFRQVAIGNWERHLTGGPTLHWRYKTSLWDPRLWLAFLIHDWGYWGKPNMDGAEGETHPRWAAEVMDRLCGEPWGDLCLYHSRFYAKRNDHAVSPLCYADKLAIVYTPWWLYLPCMHATGEIHEYMKDVERQNPGLGPVRTSREWLQGVQAYVRGWVDKFKDGSPDTATTPDRQPNDLGVHQ